MASSGRHAGPHAATRRRSQAIGAIVVVGILAFAGGFLLASRGGGETAAPSPPASPTKSPRPSRSAAATPTASVAPSPTVAPTSATPSPAALGDGRRFGLIVGAAGMPPGSVTLRVDVARFLTGDAADHAAAARGEPTPVPNGYFIVNDDPTPLKWPVAPSVKVRYIPENMCCEVQPGTLEGFLAAVEGTAMTDYPSLATTYWWLTVKDGRVVAIEQQYLP